MAIIEIGGISADLMCKRINFPVIALNAKMNDPVIAQPTEEEEEEEKSPHQIQPVIKMWFGSESKPDYVNDIQL